MKCLNCGTKTYNSIGGKDICPTCGYGSVYYKDPLTKIVPSKPNYHARTFELLKQVPTLSLNNLQALRAFEYRTNIKLPEAFYEWFCFEDAAELLTTCNFQSQPIQIDEFSLPLEAWWSFNPVSGAVLPFLAENQGVCTWAIRLDSGDDPIVMIEVDSAVPPKWQLCSPGFSEWVYGVARGSLIMERVRFQAQAAALSEQDLKFLQAEFQGGGHTYAWPGAINYQFLGRWGDLIIWTGDGQADWFLAPHNGSERLLLEQLWQCGDLASSLYGMDEAAKGWLEALRQEGKQS